MCLRLSRKSAVLVADAGGCDEAVGLLETCRRPPEGFSGGCKGVSVELQEVVGGRDEAPLDADGGASSSAEAVELRVAEHRLDHRLALPIKRAAVVAGEDSAHEGVVAAFPAAAGTPALAGVGGNQDRGAAINNAFHLLPMPVAGVGQQDSWAFVNARCCEFALRGVEHRFELSEVRRDA